MDDKESSNNAVIKGLWSLSGMKSSDYIKLVKDSYPQMTGSRMRGLLSKMSHRNYRKATIDDVGICIAVFASWCGAKFDDKQKFDDAVILRLLSITNSANLSMTGDTSRKQAIRKVLELL